MHTHRTYDANVIEGIVNRRVNEHFACLLPSECNPMNCYCYYYYDVYYVRFTNFVHLSGGLPRERIQCNACARVVDVEHIYGTLSPI